MIGSHSAAKVRRTFVLQQKPLTLTQIKEFHPELQASEISMALCHLMKLKHLSRVQVPNPSPKGRKVIYKYTYHPERTK